MANSRKVILHPFTRLVIVVFGIIGGALIDDPLPISIYYLCCLLPLFYYMGLIKRHLLFLLFGILPISLSYILIYILLRDGDSEAWYMMWQSVSKILSITTFIQLGLSIPPSQLFGTLKSFGLSGDNLLVILGAFAVFEDVIGKASKIVTARYSRGFIRSRNTLNSLRQLPYIFIPLITGVLRGSYIRSLSWDEKDMKYLILKFHPRIEFSIHGIDITILTASIGWIVLAIYF
tara:strand:+ start:4595 stop:5293 length:699 start_codon:yes stop_codon:yes gene_type:complete